MDVLKRVAQEAGETPARLALAWVTQRPGVSSTLMGVSRVAQVAENIASLDLVISAEHRAALDAVSAPDPRMLYTLFTSEVRQFAVSGGSHVTPWR
ncbi:aldo/keto reductase [Rhodoferax sp.]|uniref:aldo/keto reductase n=1 Tax=Rhodoferax sp. TaxID=50421 RepID=UPI003A10142E